MEMIYCILATVLMLSAAVTTAFIAKWMGRSFWLWLFISIPLSVLALCILLCLPGQTKDETDE